MADEKRRRYQGKRHPLQPLIIDEQGTIRFQQNQIVRFLLDHGGFDLNTLYIISEEQKFTRNDWEQLNQLIGYSVSGFHELSCVRHYTHTRVDRAVAEFLEKHGQT